MHRIGVVQVWMEEMMEGVWLEVMTRQAWGMMSQIS